eukprot:2432611-Prymnesium_polylepis.1
MALCFSRCFWLACEACFLPFDGGGTTVPEALIPPPRLTPLAAAALGDGTHKLASSQGAHCELESGRAQPMGAAAAEDAAQPAVAEQLVHVLPQFGSPSGHGAHPEREF